MARLTDFLAHSQTDHRHGQAWNHYKFYGRVRRWDGLIVILRVPVRVRFMFLVA
jgi:hypothetical protein